MTLPPQGHPQHELRRRIADCRQRLRRTRTGQNRTEQVAHVATHAAHDETTAEESDDAPARRSRQRAERAQSR
ncbi:MAG TPA: hypothetical protein VE775_06790 [Pyrinomonadaceae bacterium]|nr:hypothetical protein [Pyrinomonadaceae bacterium]